MIKILYILKKEFLLIIRDIHAVTVLFIMPAVFIMIMSLAMRDLFELHSTVSIDVLAVNQDAGNQSEPFLKAMDALRTFRFHLIEKGAAADKVPDKVKEQMLARDYKFGLIIKENFSAFVEKNGNVEDKKPLELLVNPAVNVQTQLVLKSALDGKLAKLRGDAFIDRMGSLLPWAGTDREKQSAAEESPVEVNYVYKEGRYSKIPSAVQQSVPAWLVFSMFFIVIPISNTFISEREQGTLMRLKSMNVSRFYLIMGKMAPYLLINAIQVIIMIAMGVAIVPLCGGTALTLGDSIGGLILIAASVSFSAISMALLIASAARTTEQATTVGGVLNIIFGALGGIMVPKFVMPGFMQDLANMSPMSWGLEGFLDIFLRNGNVSDVLPKSLYLFIFGVVMLTLTVILLRRRGEI
ncbi:MAG: ABC transporter permease [Deltaproteobacteria bacterium]|nr:ABC transporter permease [Deltaproteobacteria bacterium]